MDKTDRFYYKANSSPNITARESKYSPAVNEDIESNPKDIKIFDTSMFKSSLRIREAIIDKIDMNIDARRGLVTYTEYLRGAQSTPK